MTVAQSLTAWAPGARPDTAGAGRRGWLPGRNALPSGRVLGWMAFGCAAASIGLIILAAAAAPQEAALSRMTFAPLPGPAGPPWWPTALRMPWSSFVAVCWIAALLGCAGVLAGLAAVSRGARTRPGALLAAAIAATAVLTALPPAGSGDPLNYAAYGRMVVLGVSPYVVTPRTLDHRTHDPVAKAVFAWRSFTSVYGPLGTAEEAAAAALGGTAPARIIFWLKLWNALAFLAVALALDRLLRGDPARRLRAHLLWSVNPLLLWGLVTGAHIDGFAAAFGLLGVIVLTRPREGTAGLGAWWRPFTAGLLTGAAADIKINFAIFILGAAWACRRSPKSLLAVAGGALVTLVPSYAAFGQPAVLATITRNANSTWDSFYQLISRITEGWPSQPVSGALAIAGFLAVAAAALRWLPDRCPELPAVRPVLALSLAWLLTGQFQRPWYDAMLFCVLALYPATVLDWALVTRLGVCTAALLPTVTPRMFGGHDAAALFFADYGKVLTPVVRLAALAVVALLLLRPGWRRYLSGPAPAPD